MATVRTFGRSPTLGEIRGYYLRDDMLDFLYDDCRRRSVQVMFHAKGVRGATIRETLRPGSREDLANTVRDMFTTVLEPAYRGKADHLGIPLDAVRPQTMGFLSFHSDTFIRDGDTVKGFDLIVEADPPGWREAFESQFRLLTLLTECKVCFRMKYSGVRSLHLMIPWEALPVEFRGKPIIDQRGDLITRMVRVAGELGRIMHGANLLRLAYSLNEDNGLVSLPIHLDELADFRPWQAHLNNVTIDQPWHADVPDGAQENTLRFLQELFDNTAADRRVTVGWDPAAPVQIGQASPPSQETLGQWGAVLDSDDPAARVEAAWRLVDSGETIPLTLIGRGLSDKNADVRWYLTEALRRHGDEAVQLASRMLVDPDQMVRISAGDLFLSTGHDLLDALWTAALSSARQMSRDVRDEVSRYVKHACGGRRDAVRDSFFACDGPQRVAENVLTAVDSAEPGLGIESYVRRISELAGFADVPSDEAFGPLIRALSLRLDQTELAPDAPSAPGACSDDRGPTQEVFVAVARVAPGSAVEALVSAGHATAAAVLVRVLAVKEGASWRAASSALAALGPGAIPSLVQALDDSKPHVVARIVGVLGAIAAPETVTGMVRALHRQLERITELAGDQEISDPVKTRRMRPNALAVLAIIRALGEVGSPPTRIKSVLKALLEGDAHWTHRTVAHVLARLDATEVGRPSDEAT